MDHVNAERAGSVNTPTSQPGLFDRVVNRISRPSLRIRRNDDRRVRSHSADGSTSQMIIKQEFADIATPTGPMRLHLFQPATAGRYPGVLLYSEIYQITGPIRRMAAFLAGQGYVIGAPEVYHEYEPPGTVLAYDKPGT